MALPREGIRSLGSHASSRGDEPSMIGWVGDIERVTLGNETFRTVLFTGTHAAHRDAALLRRGHRQGGPSGPGSVHPDRGHARIELGRDEDGVDEAHDVSDDWAIVIPAGIWHNVINTGTGDLKLYSLYAPPEHPDGTVHPTKADAPAAEHAG